MFCLAALSAMSTFTNGVLIGNLFASAPNGVAFISADRSHAVVLDPGGSYFAGIAAPDNSYHLTRFQWQPRLVADAEAGRLSHQPVIVTFEWGRVGDGIVGRFKSSGATKVELDLTKGWTKAVPQIKAAPGGATIGDWSLKASPAAVPVDKGVELSVSPSMAAYVIAGFGKLPNLAGIDEVLDSTAKRYEARRPSASGDWGDFVGPIADNLNNSRVYSSDDKSVAITVSRGWAPDPDSAPYFCWDSFFNGALSCLDDPTIARDTVRAILRWQSPEGLVPNFGHWQFAGGRASTDRSQPPVGSMCVWQIQQRWPDRKFLAEVYPKLLLWHRWWPKERDGKHDGLLEWGSSKAGEQGARWETGWDDTPHYDGSHMEGEVLNAYAVDLNSLWAMDAEYLALIADTLGHRLEAAELRAERQRTLKLINERLWNPELGIYCSRLWDGQFLTRLTPMNFYPLIAGAPNVDQAKQCLAVMTDPKRFWGTWILPTVAYDDPVWPHQDYWRGKVWAPVNYLVFKGLMRYADASVTNHLADKSVELFMKNWTAKGVCGENYLSSTGEQSSDPHYTWGSLLCLIGLENVCAFTPDGKLRLNGTLDKRLSFRNIPIGGRLYELEAEPGRTRLIRGGHTILEARSEVVIADMP